MQFFTEGIDVELRPLVVGDECPEGVDIVTPVGVGTVEYGLITGNFRTDLFCQTVDFGEDRLVAERASEQFGSTG